MPIEARELANKLLRDCDGVDAHVACEAMAAALGAIVNANITGDREAALAHYCGLAHKMALTRQPAQH